LNVAVCVAALGIELIQIRK